MRTVKGPTELLRTPILCGGSATLTALDKYFDPK